ncbi:MAG: AMP-binding protein [Bacteroidetes bacterium]|nr:AMP-binding protein [Bacteroidota bacterium]
MILDRVPLKPLWAPSRSVVEQSNLKKFQNWLFVKKGLYFRDYHDLWDWSVTDIEDFWECIWSFCDIKTHSLYWDVVVTDKKELAKTQWFTGSTINYAEHIFRHKNSNKPAFFYQTEGEPLREFSWRDLEKQVASVAAYLRQVGVSKGDHVMGILPNTPQSVVAFLATHAIGGIWSIFSPETDAKILNDRARTLSPKVVFVHSSATFKSTTKTVWVTPTGEDELHAETWTSVLKTPSTLLEFTHVPFAHPLWVSFPSFTPVTHSTGGTLLEHLRLLTIHQNFKQGDRVLWHDSSSSIAWQFSLSTLLTGAIPVFYDAPVHGSKGSLWESIDKNKINHFGCTAAFLTTIKSTPLPSYKFNALQSITTFDGPLSAEEFEWVYQQVKKDVWLVALSTHPYLGSSLVGGCPTLPVFAGEAQCVLLGCKSTKYPEKSQLIRQEWNNDLLAQPLPSLPYMK